MPEPIDWRVGDPQVPPMIAALYVDPTGTYAGVDGVDLWDEKRDARGYDGPWAVVAHPPCARWGRYWPGGPSAKEKRVLGDDGGCFKEAFVAVCMFGGVIEHPEGSHAWRCFGIPTPPRSGGWVKCIPDGWTCCIEQGHYGHPARKATWLYVRGVVSPPSLVWGPAENKLRLDEGYHTQAERSRAVRTGICQRLSKKQRGSTPAPFRDLLLSIARMAQPLDKGRPIFFPPRRRH